jgi:hypothetical protein
VSQLEARVDALEKLEFATEKFAEINGYGTSAGSALWAASSSE